MRVGMGYDVHRLTEDRDLILGGVKIDWEKGLLGHSDADVLIHAVMDALLGAAALGDIGKHFPDTDPAYKGISSILLLEHVTKLLREHHYEIGNIDATIIAQKPKMAPHIPQMRANMAKAMGINESQLNIRPLQRKNWDLREEKKELHLRRSVFLMKEKRVNDRENWRNKT